MKKNCGASTTYYHKEKKNVHSVRTSRNPHNEHRMGGWQQILFVAVQIYQKRGFVKTGFLISKEWVAVI